MKSLITSLVVVVLAGGAGFYALNRGEDTRGNTSYSTQALSSEESQGLAYMREEEKLARDVYLAMYDKWGLQTFANIVSSEEEHYQAVGMLLDKYGIDDPSKSARGVFKDENLSRLYTELVARGNTSLESALAVGVLIEELDISDLESRLAQTDRGDIKNVYENLAKGSRNHLRAFYSQLTSRGGVYTPQYLSQAVFDEIVSSSRENGPR